MVFGHRFPLPSQLINLLQLKNHGDGDSLAVILAQEQQQQHGTRTTGFLRVLKGGAAKMSFFQTSENTTVKNKEVACFSVDKSFNSPNSRHFRSKGQDLVEDKFCFRTFQQMPIHVTCEVDL